MEQDKLINDTVRFVKQTLKNAEGGHDWWHIYRVWKLSEKIAISEKADITVVVIAALLHDIADAKFNDGDDSIGPKMAADFLKSNNVQESVINHVVAIIKNISFAGGNQVQNFHSPELDIVQDADRLDALGAIGIARTFNYGGFKNRELYNPEIAPNLNMTKEEYRKSTAPTINHFYEKLLLLKDRMNTATAREMAKERHLFMELYLENFYAEWEGEK